MSVIYLGIGANMGVKNQASPKPRGLAARLLDAWPMSEVNEPKVADLSTDFRAYGIQTGQSSGAAARHRFWTQRRVSSCMRSSIAAYSGNLSHNVDQQEQ
jgi:hypothetical protein